MSRRRERSNPADRLFVDYPDDDAAIAAEAALVDGTDAWEDPDFPAAGESLYTNPFKPPRGCMPPNAVAWNRINAGEISGCESPVTFKEGTSAGDVIQGQIGNCWFISAMSVLGTHQAYVNRNFVSEENKAKGIYTFKFYKGGAWRYVHIDDRIPCDRKDRPLFAKGKDSNETWVMLLEKAYAKLHGCYGNLQTGYIDYGLRDLTGGLCQKLKWADKATKAKLAAGKLYDELKASLDEGSLAGCSFNGGENAIEHDRGDGILAGHAYGILQMKVVEADGEEFKMVQCRNPWGMQEWKGDWCDNDFLWEDYPSIKEALNPGPFVNDGTFWIDWVDFKEQFNQIFLCYNFPDTYDSLQFQESWTPGSTTAGHGGCPKYPSFTQNPQFTFSVEEDFDLFASCTRSDHRWRNKNKPYNTAVGFVIMDLGTKKRVPKFSPKRMKAMSRTFAKTRTVSGGASLPAGRYALIPCHFSPGKAEDPFTLELHISKPTTFEQVGKEVDDIDEGLDEDDEDEDDDDGSALFDDPVDEPREPEEEGRGLKVLHEMMGDMMESIKELTAEIGDLDTRVAALEG